MLIGAPPVRVTDRRGRRLAGGFSLGCVRSGSQLIKNAIRQQTAAIYPEASRRVELQGNGYQHGTTVPHHALDVQCQIYWVTRFG